MKPTQLDSMNRLRVQAEDKAALYRRALVLACHGDEDQVAFYVSEAAAAQEDDSGVMVDRHQTFSQDPPENRALYPANMEPPL